jgi:hypothetical protein
MHEVPWWEWAERKRPRRWSDHRAREACRPSTPKAPWPRTEVEFDESVEVGEYELLASEQEAARIWRALMLAPSLGTCRALLRGESVPLDRLDTEWVERFGRLR